MRNTHVSGADKLKLSEKQLRQSICISALLASMLPPMVGGTIMALIGFHPIQNYYAIFTHWHILFYIFAAIALIQWWARRVVAKIIRIPLQVNADAKVQARKLLIRLPWWFILIITLYSMGGVYNADLTIESLGLYDYSPAEHLRNQLGIVLVVIITIFPIYFYLIDRIARYLGPRDIVLSAYPLWSKVLVLGIVTPLLIDSVIVGYYINYTGHFGWRTFALWSSLLMLAMGGTWLAWRSIRQGLLPLQAFVESSDPGELQKQARNLLIPLSMDELGVLTQRYLQLIESDRQASILAEAVMENAGALVLVLDRDGRIVRFNLACEELTGYSFEEIAGKYPWDTVLPPEDAETIRINAFEALTNNPESLRGSYTNYWVAKTGKRYLIDWSNTLLLDNVGNVQYVVSLGINVTEQRAAEEELRTSNQIVSAVLDTTPVSIAYLDPQLNFIRVNKPYASADNKEPEYFIGKNHFELYPSEENEAIFRRVVETGEAYSAHAKPFEYEHNPERGVSHWDWTLTPIKDSDGTVTGLVLSLLDVTDRIQALEMIQRSEQELKRVNESLESRVAERTAELSDALSLNQQMLDTLVVGVSAYGEDGKCEFANEAMGRIINASHEEVLAQNFRTIPSWQKYGLLPLAEKALKQGSIEHDEFHLVSSFGREVWLDVTFSHFKRAGERHLLFLATDISDRKQAEQDIISARDEAERANKAKSEFLSRMSHELRTPMNAILGFTQILEMEDLNPHIGDYINEIHQAGEHLLELINELLDLSRIESGKLTISMRLVEINTIISESMKLVENIFKDNELVFNNQCTTDINLISDPTRLRQILVNLLSNAAKYNKQGGSVTLSCEFRGDNRLRIFVADTGPGIATEKLAKLFTPFERLGAEYGTIEGTGVGLALSKQIAELMGGEIGVESSLGEGSTFWVELPIGEIDNHQDTSQAEQSAPLANVGKSQILYIEDNLTNLRVVEALFKRNPNFKLLSATNGEFGLEQARRYHPDAILLDINLPDMDGYEVLNALQVDPATAGIPVIAISAEAMPVDIEKGLEAGFVNYLTKPVVVEELLASLDSVLKK